MNQELVQRIKNTPNLPSMPAIAMQVLELAQKPDVDITEIPGSAPDRTGLQVKVEEQATGELSFSAGYSSVDQLVLDLGVTQRNFRERDGVYGEDPGFVDAEHGDLRAMPGGPATRAGADALPR